MLENGHRLGARMNIIARLMVVLVLTAALAFGGRPAFAQTPSISVVPISGPWGGTVAVVGTNFPASQTGIAVTWDTNAVVTNLSAGTDGRWSTSFTVPYAAPGPHNVGARYTGSSVTDVVFTLPSPALTLSRISGPVGTSLTVGSSGFGANEIGVVVTYDGTTIASGITANGQGAWSTTFAVPASASGAHVITALASTTLAATVGQSNFTVTPSVSLSRGSGAPGSSLTVTGAGFAANETSIAVTYDGIAAASGITANAQGGWNTTLTVPPSASGPHAIGALGNTTAASSVSQTTFLVSGGLTINRASGVPGSPLTLSGSGFAANETGITVTYDGATVATGISANSQGAWSTTFAVPPSASGSHSIGASGSTTQAGAVSTASFTVTGGITLGRSSGAPTGSVTVNGSGFAANETGITVTYDGNTVATGIRADGQGSWSATFTVPPSTSGSHSISASGSVTPATSVGQASFTVTGGITLSRTSGAPGSTVTVNGSGFGANETGIAVTYDGATVASSISASGQGGVEHHVNGATVRIGYTQCWCFGFCHAVKSGRPGQLYRDRRHSTGPFQRCPGQHGDGEWLGICGR